MKGLKEFKEAQIKITNGYSEEATIENRPSVEEAIEFVRNMIKDYSRECLVAINIVGELVAINYFVASYGNGGMTVNNHREVVQAALLSNATHVMVIHNHPGNILKFSQADYESARGLARVLKDLEMQLYDSAIVTSDDKMLSMKEVGLIGEYNSLAGKYKMMDSEMMEKIKEMEKDDTISIIQETCERIGDLEEKYGGNNAEELMKKRNEIMKRREGESVKEYNIRVREELKKMREEGE